MFESVDWKISKKLISYDFAISEMEKRVLEIKQNSAKELVWLLEHQPIYTGGTSAQKEDLKKQGFDPSVIEDKLYFYQKGKYVEIDSSLYEKIQSGEQRF